MGLSRIEQDPAPALPLLQNLATRGDLAQAWLVALELGPVQIAPGIAVELATRPGIGQPTQLLFEPGLSVGTKF